LSDEQVAAVIEQIRSSRATYYEIADDWLMSSGAISIIARKQGIHRNGVWLKKLLSPERLQSLREEIALGDTAHAELARRYGVAYEQVRWLRVTMGIKPLPRRPRTRWDELSAEQQAEFLSLCRSSTLTYREVGKLFGISAAMANRYAQRAGISRIRWVFWKK
jgi:hypothetical protein